MRISDGYLHRDSENKEVSSKLFVMMEGTETEPRYFGEYFKGVRYIKYLPFERNGADLSWSNPKILMKQLEMSLGHKISELTYKDFFPFLLRHLREKNKSIDVNYFRRELRNHLTNHGVKNIENDYVDEVVLETVIDEVKEKSFIDLVRFDLSNVVKDFELFNDEMTYSPEVDKIILIVDRDKDSFSEKQYVDVLQKGKENKIDVFITNPCFEFFLALHYSDLKDINEKELLENTKVNGKTFAYLKLLEFDPKYTKSNFDASKYMSKIDTVKVNLRLYENDPDMLMNNVGSNLGKLLERYRRE